MKNKTYLKKMAQLTRWFICLMILGGLWAKSVNAQCGATYTITFSTIPSGTYNDEGSWQIRNALGAVVSTGGPYFGGPGTSFSGTYIASGINPNHGPFTFWVETQGTYGDNIVTYTVSCPASGVLLTGTIGGVPGVALTNVGTFCCAAVSPPTVTSFTPSSGCGGTQSVAITGTNFTGATAVTFGGTNAQSFIVNSATSITAVPSPTGTTGFIAVTTPAGTGSSSPSVFTVTSGPSVSIAPPSSTICPGGSQLLTASPSGGGETYVWSTTATTQAITVSPPSTTTYTVTVTNTSGCTGTSSRTVTVAANPSVGSFTVTPNPGCQTGFTLNSTATGGGSLTATGSSGNVNIGIPDNSTVGVTSTIAISGAPAGSKVNSLGSVRVTLNVTHTWDSDVDVFLVAPGGTRAVELTTDNGGSGDNYTNTILQTGSAPSVTTGIAPFTSTYGSEATITTAPNLTSAAPTNAGSYVGVIPALAVDGADVNGTWTLRAFDDEGSDVGTLVNWTLLITYVPNYTQAYSGAGTIGGTTYSGNSQATGSAAVTTIPPGPQTYTVTVTSGVAGCTATSTASVTVVASPSASNAGVDQTVCVSPGSATLAANTPAAGTGQWSVVSGSGSFVSNTNPGTVVSGLSLGANVFRWTISNAPCTATTDDVTITTQQVPTTSNAGSNQSICNNLQPATLAANTPTSGTGLWSVVSGSGSFTSNTNPGTTVTGGLGLNTYRWTISNGVCTPSTDDVDLTVNANPAETATNDGPKCETEMVQLSLTSVSPNPPTSWAWTGPNTFTSNAQNPTNGPLVPTDAGTYNVTYTDANGCTGTASTALVVGPAPSATIPVTPVQQICGGSGVVPVNLVGTAPWSFTLFDGTTSVPFSGVTNPSDNYAVPAGAVGTHNWTVSVVTDNACGSGNVSGSATIIVSSGGPGNTISTVGGTAAACSSSVAQMTTNAVSGQNVFYSWNTGSNSSTVLFSNNIGGPFSAGPFLTNTNSVYAQFGALAAGSSGYNICVQGTNGCGSTNNKCTWIRGTVSPPATISPASTIQCSGATGQAYSAAAVPSATVYTWSFSVPGATITGNGTPNVTIDFPAFSSGNLCVTAALACGGSSTSAPKCVTLTNATANPGAMSGPTKICPGQTGTVYSIPAVTGASTYNWTVPAGATITNNTGTSITVSWPNPYTLNANVCVTTTSTCGATSLARCKSVISGIPSTPGNISGQAAGVCGQTIVYSVAAVPGATSYTWVVPAGGIVNSGAGTNAINVTWGIITTGQMTVTANSACGSSGLRTLNIAGAPATPGAIAQLPPTVCNNGPANFTITAVTGATGYIWAVPANGATIDNGQGTTSIDVTWGTGAGSVTVKSSNVCGVSSTRSLLVTPGCRLATGSVSITGTEMNLVAYPNPAHEKVTVSFNASVKEAYSLNITDLAGRVISVQNYSSSQGVNTLDIDLSTIAKGVYTLEVKSATSNQKARLIIE